MNYTHEATDSLYFYAYRYVCLFVICREYYYVKQLLATVASICHAGDGNSLYNYVIEYTSYL